ncbi:hypothetical protein LLH06_02665 [Mucilaginibacter daejeonensis]|uniref:hypothetical protein n=1 Tax=Mucilaginibacter daejeonensis TaxID=398049 RepID=UPI001D17C83E|nr:hypothetical protein [Mucilaginibacter daejeonensis]UEG53876.1 hypothetical protein LLH06_02665 [Mucilaginibacter daejeonensis]
MYDKLQYHQENKKYLTIYRKVGSKSIETSHGYIVAFAKDFVILQETNDFEIDGYIIIPVAQIHKLRFNNVDKYFDKIMAMEKLSGRVVLKYHVSLDSWPSIFRSLQDQELTVIVECEDPDDKSFDIGPIIKIEQETIHVQNFDALGFFDLEPSIIAYGKITKVQFNGRYENIFSKYTRHRKVRR